MRGSASQKPQLIKRKIYLAVCPQAPPICSVWPLCAQTWPKVPFHSFIIPFINSQIEKLKLLVVLMRHNFKWVQIQYETLAPLSQL